MAQRIKLLCLGATLAPYSTINKTAPQLPSGNISEYLSFDVDQLQRNNDTTTAQRATYPSALSSIIIKYVDANHFKSDLYFINQTQDQVNNSANM